MTPCKEISLLEAYACRKTGTGTTQPADMMSISFLLVSQSFKMRLDLKFDHVWRRIREIQLLGFGIHGLRMSECAERVSGITGRDLNLSL